MAKLTIEQLELSGKRVSFLGADLNAPMRPVGERLEALLAQPVPLTPDRAGREVSEGARVLEPGQVLLLGNLCFHKERGAVMLGQPEAGDR